MYSTGQFAFILKVSSRTIRHYDDIGLLKPCSVNEENGYRFYSTDQIGKAKRIIGLKEAGLSLDEIKKIINGSEDDLLEIAAKRLKEIEKSIDELTLERNRLRSIVESGKDRFFCEEGVNYEISIIKMDMVNAISKRCIIDMRNVGEIVGDLYEVCSRNGLKVNGNHIVKYCGEEVDPENEDIEVYLPVESRKEKGIKFSCISEGRFVIASVHSIAEKGEAHRAIIDWAAERNINISDKPFEQYSIRPGEGVFKVDIFYRII